MCSRRVRLYLGWVVCDMLLTIVRSVGATHGLWRRLSPMRTRWPLTDELATLDEVIGCAINLCVEG